MCMRCLCRMVGSILGQLLSRSPDTNALVRTTAAVTLLRGGTAQNVLPQSGNVTINFRHLPGARTMPLQLPSQRGPTPRYMAEGPEL
jgi:acetylornithine deacetylase/succinyl-diaminopimelate desuccinylase-like protein